MTNEPQTYRLLVTLPGVTGEEADAYVEDLEDSITGRPVGPSLTSVPDATVTHAPQLWTVMIDGPEFDVVLLRATEQECWEALINWAADEGGHRMPLSHAALHPAIVAAWFSDHGYVIDVKQHEYPVHPASVVQS